MDEESSLIVYESKYLLVGFQYKSGYMHSKDNISKKALPWYWHICSSEIILWFVYKKDDSFYSNIVNLNFKKDCSTSTWRR